MNLFQLVILDARITGQKYLTKFVKEYAILRQVLHCVTVHGCQGSGVRDKGSGNDGKKFVRLKGYLNSATFAALR